MAQSKELTAFYNAYHNWLLDPVEYSPFSKNEGLCSSIRRFACFNEEHEMKLLYEIRQQFKKSGLWSVSPFHQNLDYYFQESDAGLCHLNQKRIAWVKAHLKGDCE